MDNSAASSRHYNNPNLAVNNLQLLFANFGLAANNPRFQLESDGAGAASLHVNPPPPGFASAPRSAASLHVNPPPPGFASAPRTHQVPEQQYRLFDEYRSSYPQSMWAVDDATGNYSNFPQFNYMNNTEQQQQQQKRNWYAEQAITPEGSVELQRRIFYQGPGAVDEIFSGIIGSIITVMNNQHGRYVVINLIPLLDQNQVAMIVQKLSQRNGKPILYASFNNAGSHSLQRLMKPLVRYNLTAPLVAALAGEFSRLMKDSCGRRVVTNCVEVVPVEQSEPLYRACMEHWLELATHKTGCPSLNHFVEHVKGPLRLELFNLIADHTVFLAQDPTGNHALQRIIHLEDPRITEKICRNLRGEYGLLALQKSGSYVVEKCLNSSGWVYALDDLLLDEAELLRIAKDRHGNYVVKKALQVSKFRSFTNHYLKFVKKLNNNLSQLQSGYGKNVLLEMANLNLTTTLSPF